MYSEKIKFSPDGDDEEKYHENGIRNEYFKNRNCLANVLDFLKQDVVIMRGDYFSFPEGFKFLLQSGYVDLDYETDYDTDFECFYKDFHNIYAEDMYHICRLEDYITIVDGCKRCIFTNKDMEEGDVTGTIVWVKNFEELLKEFSNSNLMRISNAIVHPSVTHRRNLNEFEEVELHDEGKKEEYLDRCFFGSMEVYQPEVIYEYTIDSCMENDCLDIYNKLVKKGLSPLVNKYIPSYKWCEGDTDKVEDETKSDLCECGGLRALCHLYI